MAKRNKVPKQSTLRLLKIAEVRVKAIEAGEIRLTDRVGRVRALLEMGLTGPRLAMMHEDGTVAFELVLAKDGPSARFADEAADTRVFVGANRGSARLGMADGAGSQRLFIGVSSRGTPTISLYDQQQRQEWTAGRPRKQSAGKAATRQHNHGVRK